MTMLKANKRWICLAVILYLTGCGAESESDQSTSAPNNSSAGVARVELVSDASTVDYEGSITLNWTASQVQDCVALGDWSGNKSTSGSETIDSLVADSIFELACYEIDAAQGSSATVAYKGKRIKDRVDISVKGPKQPTLSMSASPTTVSVNGTTTISWSSKFAKSCTASGGWSGNKTTSGSQTISALTADSTFNFTCSGDGGSANDSVSITVAAPSAPWVSLTTSSSSLPYDGSATLNWNSGNSSGCTASGDWSGSLATAGSQTTGALTADSTFNITCSGAGGSANDSVSITVAAPSAPWVSLTTSSSSLPYDGSATLNWNSGNSSGCTASGDWSGSLATAGSQTTGALTADSTFNITCSGAGGSANDSVSITVAAPVPTLSFSASPSSVNANGTTTLSWTGTNVTSCTASGDWSGNMAAAGSEVKSAMITDSQFTLNCSGPGGSVNKTVNVIVLQSSNGTALLSWTPPIQNTDGSLLKDLAGYTIRYGTSPGNYSETITLNNPGLSSYLVENLFSADWFFVMTSINSSGIESGNSREVGKTIN